MEAEQGKGLAMDGDGAVRFLWAGQEPVHRAFPPGKYHVDRATPFSAAVRAVERAGAGSTPYAACFLEWAPGEFGPRDLDDLLRLGPALFVVVEGDENDVAQLSLGDWASPDRCLTLARPVRPLLRKSLAEHLGARWAAETASSRRLSVLEAEARSTRASGQRSEERLQVLHGIVEKLHGAVRMDDALRVTLGEISRFLGAKTGSLLLLEGPERLRVLEAVGPNRERILGLEVPLEKSRIARFALEEREPILVEDIQDSERFRETEEAIRFRASSILSVPLFCQGEAVGVLNFGSDRRGGKFTGQDRDLVVTLGRHVAIALEKARLLERLRRAAEESIRALAGAIEAKDRYTRGHSDRVTRYSRLTAEAMGIGGRDLDVIVRAAILHDVGKIGVSEAVLHKPGRLDEHELAEIQRHPTVGVEIVREILAMDETLPIILHHHERFDGTGYPRGVVEGEIPLGARILAVADTFDAMTSDRPYRRGLSAEVAFAEIRRCQGTQFDPEVARIFLEHAPAWMESTYGSAVEAA